MKSSRLNFMRRWCLSQRAFFAEFWFTTSFFDWVVISLAHVATLDFTISDYSSVTCYAALDLFHFVLLQSFDRFADSCIIMHYYLHLVHPISCISVPVTYASPYARESRNCHQVVTMWRFCSSRSSVSIPAASKEPFASLMVVGTSVPPDYFKSYAFADRFTKYGNTISNNLCHQHQNEIHLLCGCFYLESRAVNCAHWHFGDSWILKWSRNYWNRLTESFFLPGLLLPGVRFCWKDPYLSPFGSQSPGHPFLNV